VPVGGGPLPRHDQGCRTPSAALAPMLAAAALAKCSPLHPIAAARNIPHALPTTAAAAAGAAVVFFLLAAAA